MLVQEAPPGLDWSCHCCKSSAREYSNDADTLYCKTCGHRFCYSGGCAFIKFEPPTTCTSLGHAQPADGDVSPMDIDSPLPGSPLSTR